MVLRVMERVQVELLFGLLRGDFDFIIAQTEFYDLLDGLRQRVIFRDRLRVFARPKHRPGSATEPKLAGPRTVPLGLSLWWVAGSVRFWRNLRAAEGIDLPQQLIESGSIDFTKALVAASDHLAMLPEHAVRTNPGQEQAKAAADHCAGSEPRYRCDIPRRDRLWIRQSRDLIRQIETVGADLSRER